MNLRRNLNCLSYLVVGSFLAVHTNASVLSVGQSAFPVSATVITFNGLSSGTEVNGLSVNGVGFSYTLAGLPSNDQVEIDDGPGITNHITPPNIVSVGDPSGTLTVTLPQPVTMFGYGFALDSFTFVSSATTATVFDGSTSLGSFSFNAVPDPDFAGGFAGIQSTTAFNRIELTFNTIVGPAFAADNLTFVTNAPEPSTLLIMALGIALLAGTARYTSPR